MKPLVVKVEEADSADTWTYVFDDSPVSVGRAETTRLRIARASVPPIHGSFFYDVQLSCWTYVEGDVRRDTRGAADCYA